MDKKTNLQMNKVQNYSTAYTLAEVMVVLVIIGVLAAAFLPIMTRRQNKASVAKSTLWTKMANGTDVYNTSAADGGRAAIGNDIFVATDNAMLLLNPPTILLKQNGTKTGFLTAWPNISLSKDIATYLNQTNIAFGACSAFNSYTDEAIAIGRNAAPGSSYAIAIGLSSSSNSISIGNSASTEVGSIAIGRSAQANNILGIAIGNSAIAQYNGIAIGRNVNQGSPFESNTTVIGDGAHSEGSSSVAIGLGANNTDSFGVAIGPYAAAKSYNTVAFGSSAQAFNQYSTALGASSRTKGDYAIAIGNNAWADGEKSIAIGKNAWAKGKNSIAILGTATNDNDIMLGTTSTTVIIAGQLHLGTLGPSGGPNGLFIDPSGNVVYYNSDRRLKNIVDPSKAGLDQIKQLKTYNYTYKADKTERPIVGVIAQDLRKVFPNAVRKENGLFLTIRQEDMFYAMIRSVQQLDIMIQRLGNKVKLLTAKIKNLDTVISDVIKNDQVSYKQINTLEARRIKLEARVKDLQLLAKSSK